MTVSVTQLYPTPSKTRPLHGLYLAHDLRNLATADGPYIYSNFVASLDGRISEKRPDGRRGPPMSISHPHDWRLYLELAAQADAVLTSGSRLRELAQMEKPTLQCVYDIDIGDLGEWRRQHSLAPAPTCLVLSATLDLPLAEIRAREHGPIIVISGAPANPTQRQQFRDAGIELYPVRGPRVTAEDIHRLACERNFRTLYSIGGPEILYTLASARLLHRLYLSISLRLLAGTSFDTLLRGETLHPPIDTTMVELHLMHDPSYLFATLDIANAGTRHTPD